MRFLPMQLGTTSATFWTLPSCLCTGTPQSSVDAVTQLLRTRGIMLWLLWSLKYPESQYLLRHGLITLAPITTVPTQNK